MSVLDVLDATRLCSRWSEPLADPAAWVMAPAVIVRRERITMPPPPHSWRATARNPQAILLTGLVGAGVVLDAGQRLLAAALRP